MRKQRWEREFSATEYGPPCVQFMDFHKNDRFSAQNMRAESEDCLSLNIFAPYNSEDESGQHPILVWVHGGSFLAGSADTGIDMEVLARNLVFRNITFVSINYRLGLFGFMSVHHSDGHVEGNFGLWDIELALEWVQRNIKQFNGDPTRVTLMGESAGAAAVSALAVSPVTKELLSGAISLSGSATAGWAIHRQVGTQPNWDMANIADYIRCNKLIDEEDLDDTLAQVPVAERDRWHKHCNLQERIPDCLSSSTGPLNSAEMLACLRLHRQTVDMPLAKGGPFVPKLFWGQTEGSNAPPSPRTPSPPIQEEQQQQQHHHHQHQQQQQQQHRRRAQRRQDDADFEDGQPGQPDFLKYFVQDGQDEVDYEAEQPGQLFIVDEEYVQDALHYEPDANNQRGELEFAQDGGVEQPGAPGEPSVHAPRNRGRVRMHHYVKHSMRLRHANLPCVIEYGGGDHKTFFPLEVLSVVIKDKMAERVRRRLQHTQFTQLCVEQLRVVNIVGVHTCVERISVERLQHAIPGAIYDPTVFPALRCKIEGGATCLIYISGKVIVTGFGRNIKHELDNLRTNNDSRVHTHNGETREAVAVKHLQDVYNEMCRVKLICIDEGQFFSDLSPVVLHMVIAHKKRVIVAALNATFDQKMFPPIAKPVNCYGWDTKQFGRNIKHELDNLRTNNDSRVHTHNGETREAVAVKHLQDVYNEMCRVKLICIDEGQFFSDLSPVVLHMVNVHKKRVIVAALNATFDQKMFPPIVELLPYADEVEWLKAVCFFCESTQAQFTRRFARQQPNNMVN
ncbi:hypothetical protein GPALN_014401 [Globodera pallida]|nr:hypothetical protein GPALN_014401 [Globodera pallida]